MSGLAQVDHIERFTVLVHVRGPSSSHDFKRLFPQYAEVKLFLADDQGYTEFRLTREQIDTLKLEGFLYLERQRMNGGPVVHRDVPS